MTAALERGEWSAARPGRTLPPGKSWHQFYRRLGGTQGRSGGAENLVPTGIRSRTAQPVVSRYTDWATRSTTEMSTRIISWGVKAAGVYGWEPCHLHVPIVSLSDSLNLLEPSGPLLACTGTVVHFTNQTQENLPGYRVPGTILEAETSRLENKQERLISSCFDLSRKVFFNYKIYVAYNDSCISSVEDITERQQDLFKKNYPTRVKNKWKRSS